jgi:5-methylcytosine-specific restriction enzyme A
MSALDEIKPYQHNSVMELVRQAGVDVSAWGDFRGGPARASSNPKYCYEWCFVEPRKATVLNLWFDNMRTKDRVVYQLLNLRRRAARVAKTPNEAAWKRHAQKADEAVATAFKNGLPLRVVVCSGKMRRADDPKAAASKVNKRLLDPISWAVTEYDSTTGECVITRGGVPLAASLDTDPEYEGFEGEKRRRYLQHRRREYQLRAKKIEEAKRRYGGRLVCEVPNCGFDFSRTYGPLGDGYAQVHHKIPLSDAPDDGRPARLDDLAVVCANCHVMIHLGGECREMADLIPLPIKVARDHLSE